MGRRISVHGVPWCTSPYRPYCCATVDKPVIPAYKTQPYVIALYTCKGIPMLWHGQEFAENWSVPSGGLGRVLFSRLLHWEYFYDAQGKALIRLYRTMGTLRARYRALSGRGFFCYYNDPFHQREGIIAYRRTAEAGGDDPAEGIMPPYSVVRRLVRVTHQRHAIRLASAQLGPDPLEEPDRLFRI